MEMAEIDKQLEGCFGRLAVIDRHGCGCVWGKIDRKHLILSAENEPPKIRRYRKLFLALSGRRSHYLLECGKIAVFKRGSQWKKFRVPK